MGCGEVYEPTGDGVKRKKAEFLEGRAGVEVLNVGGWFLGAARKHSGK
jgi:hypothetical protein